MGGRERLNWEAEVGGNVRGQIGRPCERPKWETMGGQSGRPN